MFSVALTGPIAAGKSAASAKLAQLGAHIIDYDHLARELTAAGSPLVYEIGRHFPAVVSNGILDRGRLATLVFGDDAALADLNAITHPAIRKAAEAEEKRIVRTDEQAIVIHDIPLLIETGQAYSYPYVIVVTAGEDVRLRRLAEHRSMPRAEALARMEAQAGDIERAEAADYLIVNDRTLSRLEAEVEEAFHRVRTMARMLRGASLFNPVRTSVESAQRTARKLEAAGQVVTSVGSRIIVPEFNGPALIRAGCIAIRRGWFRADPWAAVEISR
ncbi:MAG: dephospho-CoA kinase [Flaviflexus sp.]|nr:dephospho-CoA kinase [Flaviflexus sp.]